MAAFAPAAQFTTIAKAYRTAPFSDYIGSAIWTIDWLQAGYGRRAELSSLLTPAARADLPRVRHECAGQTIARWRGKRFSAVFARDPLSIRSVVKLLDRISPGQRTRGCRSCSRRAARTKIPLTVSAQLKARYCKLGAIVTKHVYPGASHDGVLDAASKDAISWISDRFHGRPAPDGCGPGAEP